LAIEKEGNGVKAKLYTLRTTLFEQKSPVYSKDSAQLGVTVIVEQSEKCYY
jgi:hypothetical protein